MVARTYQENNFKIIIQLWKSFPKCPYNQAARSPMVTLNSANNSKIWACFKNYRVPLKQLMRMMLEKKWLNQFKHKYRGVEVLSMKLPKAWKSMHYGVVQNGHIHKEKVASQHLNLHRKEKSSKIVRKVTKMHNMLMNFRSKILMMIDFIFI